MTSKQRRVHACVKLKDQARKFLFEQPHYRDHLTKLDSAELLHEVDSLVAQYLDQPSPRMSDVAWMAKLLRWLPYDRTSAPKVQEYFTRHGCRLLKSREVVPYLDFLLKTDWITAFEAETFIPSPRALNGLRDLGATTKLILRCISAVPSSSIYQWLGQHWPELSPKGTEVDDLGALLLDVLRVVSIDDIEKDRWYDWIAYWAQDGKGHIRDPDCMLAPLWKRTLGDRSAALVRPLGLARLQELVATAPSMFAHLAEQAPDAVGAKCRAIWRKPSCLEDVGHARAVCRSSNSTVRSVLVAEIAVEIAKNFSSSGRANRVLDKDHEVNQDMAEFGLSAEEVTRVLPLIEVAVLILALDPLSSQSLEASGRFVEVVRVLKGYPSIWPVLVPVLAAQDVSGDILRVVTLSSPFPEKVGPALRMLAQETPNSEVRARAIGLAEFAAGRFSTALDRTVDALVRLTTNAPVFPHPLESPSSTWLCSHTLEHHLIQNLKRAEQRLTQELPRQLGRDEEATTSEILGEVRQAFRDRELTNGVFWSDRVPAPMTVTLEERQPSKKEEASHKADIALIVDVDLPGTMEGQWAELIQVKKPYREADLTYGTGWNIKVKQLDILLSHSATAAYWLVDRDGVINCVPGKVLKALLATSRQMDPGSVRISWNQIRSAAIPMSEYLVKLLVGAWLGSTQEATLATARGNDPANVPRRILLVKVRLVDRKD